MAVTIKQTEAAPTEYPVPPTGLSDEAAALDADMIWQRIEVYTAQRYTARDVVWIVQEEGEWVPPLSPFTVSGVEVWENGGWTATTPPESPLGGYVLPGDGPYRFTASVGGGNVPAAVSEAFRRLAEYMADDPGRVGTSSYTDKIGPMEETINRAPNWLARAMQYSGAADLLRPYRRA
jgi:hypothetical protein